MRARRRRGCLRWRDREVGGAKGLGRRKSDSVCRAEMVPRSFRRWGG